MVKLNSFPPRILFLLLNWISYIIDITTQLIGTLFFPMLHKNEGALGVSYMGVSLSNFFIYPNELVDFEHEYVSNKILLNVTNVI